MHRYRRQIQQQSDGSGTSARQTFSPSATIHFENEIEFQFQNDGKGSLKQADFWVNAMDHTIRKHYKLVPVVVPG
jgi:hypothetical protein